MDVTVGVNKKSFTLQIFKFQLPLLLLPISGPALGRHRMERSMEKIDTHNARN